MKKHDIKPFDLWRKTMNVMQRHGLLLCTVSRDSKPNVMNIAWMTGGLIWSRLIITVLIRADRYSWRRLHGVATTYLFNTPDSIRP